jgi:prepilin-type N-terminal cleavage/methylation domain-containing protein/prepilin-type processing-associated H-X9-DG protein
MITRTNRPRKAGFTLIELLVVIAIIAILIGLLLPAVQKVREAAGRMRCQNNMKQMALACHSYHSSNGKLPPAVQFTASETNYHDSASNFGPNWVVLVLPYIEQSNLYNSVSTSIDAYMTTGDSGWRSIRGGMIPSMLCPSDANNHMKLWPGGPTGLTDWGRGNYGCNAFGIHGGGSTGWSSTLNGASPLSGTDPFYQDPSIPAGTPAGGVMCINWGAALTQIPDGTSTTIMINELRIGAEVGTTDCRGTWALGLPGGSVVCAQASWDCRVPNNKDDQADDVGNDSTNAPLKGMGACVGPYNQAEARSRHPGGVNVALCDGSVRFIRNDVAEFQWWALNGRDDRLSCAE